MVKYNDYYETLDVIESFLRKDLIGPVEENEVIYEEPLQYYAMGILWPKRTSAQSKISVEAIDSIENNIGIVEFDDGDDLEDFIETKNDTIRTANQYKPSAMAISAMLGQNTKKVNVKFTYAKYKYKKEIDGEWYRNSYIHEPHELNFLINIPDKCCSINIYNKEANDNGIVITCYIRRIFKDGSKLITISVVNDVKAPNEIIVQNESAIFQCELEISVSDNFLPVYIDENINSDEHIIINNMLYRNTQNYAYGHGCSVKYYDQDGIVNKISSEFMPVGKVNQMMPNTIKNDKFLQMGYWRNADKKNSCEQLSDFVNEYSMWCDLQEEQGKELDKFKKPVKISISNIRECVNRLNDGIKVLEENNIAWESFLLMNEAMLLQRVKMKRCSEESVKWYPFQLAYIIQILPDIVNGQSKYRDYLDLLWFPTGGGKTEAYLGLSAFVIFYRRLSNKPEVDGVTIIMRYTLRLLTIQQFQRATALICACEHLRRKYNICGGEINIGLWIGSSMTPNHLSDAAKVLNELLDDPTKKIYEGNPIQITECPWCGSKIDVGCYDISGNMVISCKNNDKCEFHQGLPIYVVDEDIYDKRPTFMLSTIDKFARIVWEERAKNIFGGDNILPPDLIIQDELHLISGPLGSITGLYEIAIEGLCKHNGKTPKIIASTATIKNAEKQIWNLYNKKTFQFPPNGINEEDSFFSIKANRLNKPERRYIGLCESGGDLVDLIIRVYSSLIFLRSCFIKKGLSSSVIDQYYTIVGYFNAIKDLGASSTIINDRLESHIKSLINHKFSKFAGECDISFKDLKSYQKSEELTSRKSSTEIKETLMQLSESFNNNSCFSYVLASNMLSVGIDIDRLGIMTVYNQPKSNAEYIQATSRVGRNNPGLILTMYNGMRSRDKSHYEQFSYYHKTMYKYVEASSVTPYSARAIEKALHGVFIALVRHTIPGMGGNKDAAKFRNNMNGVEDIKKCILDRVKNINIRTIRAIDDAEDWINYFSGQWENLAIINRDTFVYYDYNGGLCLLNSAEKTNNNDIPAVLNSLRNVDLTSNVYIMRRGGVNNGKYV